LQAIFLAQIEDVEKLTELFWQVSDDKLTDAQVERVLAFWEYCLAWKEARAVKSEEFMARLSRLSPYVKKLDQRTKSLLMSVVAFALLGWQS
jgi:hypothetical protein